MADLTPPTKQGTPWSPPDTAPTYPGIENNPPKKPTSRRENGDSGDDDNTKRAIDMDAETQRGPEACATSPRPLRTAKPDETMAELTDEQVRKAVAEEAAEDPEFLASLTEGLSSKRDVRERAARRLDVDEALLKPFKKTIKAVMMDLWTARGAPSDPSRDADVAETPRGAAHASEQTLRPATSKKRPGGDGLHGPPDAAKKRKSGDCKRARDATSMPKATGRWTAEEHDEFLKCLDIYGREWKKVAERITTRTAAQIRSHAQKYFKKIEAAGEGAPRAAKPATTPAAADGAPQIHRKRTPVEKPDDASEPKRHCVHSPRAGGGTEE